MEQHYRVRKIDNNTFRIEDSFLNQMYCMIGKDKAVLVDTGIGQSGLRKIITTITKLPVVVINTHGHIDHIGTNDEFDICYLHKDDWETAKEHYQGRYPASVIPGLMKELGLDLNEAEEKDIMRAKKDISFAPIEDGDMISLGDRELEVIHLPGHTKGSIGLLEQKTGMLFIGDSICSARVMLSFPYSTHISQYINSIKKLKERKSEIKTIFAGHPQIPMESYYIDRYIELSEKLLVSQKGAVRENSVFGTFFAYYENDMCITYTEDKLY